ncbi:MAG: hypothetical protein ABI569_03165 [Casimicrobiaceae bacterium]
MNNVLAAIPIPPLSTGFVVPTAAVEILLAISVALLVIGLLLHFAGRNNTTLPKSVEPDLRWWKNPEPS